MAKKQGVSGFKLPEELPPEEKMVPVSARIPQSISKKLSQEAARSKRPVSKLIDHAICAYVAFLEENRK